MVNLNDFHGDISLRLRSVKEGTGRGGGEGGRRGQENEAAVRRRVKGFKSEEVGVRIMERFEVIMVYSESHVFFFQ